MSASWIFILLMFTCLCEISTGEEVAAPQSSKTIRFEDISVGEVNPPSGTPWWEHLVSQPIFLDREPMALSVQAAISKAMDAAPELRALQNDFEIRQAEIIKQSAAFDWVSFVDTIWNRDSNPVGSALDGAASRLRSRSWSYSGGFRRRNHVGGSFEIAQDFGFLNSNSRFILPNNQGTSRLTIRYEQPLLRAKGVQYNTAATQLAVVGRDISYDQLQVGVQDYLLEVVRAYWEVASARALYCQQNRSLKLAEQVASEMENRSRVDVGPRQVNRVRIEVNNRKSKVVDARYRVLMAQERLLRFTFGPTYPQLAGREVITTSVPPSSCDFVAVESLTEVALQHRSEVHQAIRAIRSGCINEQIAKSEVLPLLNFVLTGYTAGLRGDVALGDAFLDQFRQGEPGVGTGLNFEIPWGNRAAKAALRQRKLTVARFRNELQAVIAQVAMETREQAMDCNRFCEVLTIRRETLQQAVRDLKFLETRKQFIVDGSRIADLYLEDLLQSQIRLLAAESSFLESQIGVVMADATLQRATGLIRAD